MTPDYMYNEMTWSEINDAIEYASRYEYSEREYAVNNYKKGKKIFDWWSRKPDPSPDKALRAFIDSVKKGT